MALKTQIKDAAGKLVKRTIPSRLALLTVAKATRSEPDRMAAACRWLGASNVITAREEYLLQGFWELLDFEPNAAPVTRVVVEHVRRS